MKKIIHLTDIHVGHEDCLAKFREIVTNIIYTKQPAHNYVVLITGDIVDDANEEGSYEEALVHINRLKDAGYTVLPIPGNHDYGTGALGNKKFIKRFKHAFYHDETVSYPKLDRVDNIAFIGLDSLEKELGFLDRISAEGELGEAQLNRLSDMLDNHPDATQSKYRVIYLHHHPFHPKLFLRLKDSKELGDILMQHDIAAILFGHNHDGRKWNGTWSIPRAYDGGSSTAKDGTRSPHRVIDLSKPPIYDYDAEFLHTN